MMPLFHWGRGNPQTSGTTLELPLGVVEFGWWVGSEGESWHMWQ